MKKYDAVLFDLDGTLLPLDQDFFIKQYFKALCKSLAPHGYQPDELIAGVWAGTNAMIGNDGTRTNKEAFRSGFSEACGRRVLDDERYFDEFYDDGFLTLRRFTSPSDKPAGLINELVRRGVPAVIASQPIFPMTAQLRRMEWAGLSPDGFALITAYENSRFCKPDPGYYRDIAKQIGADPSRCLMVGNDTGDDGPATRAGMDVFILTDCLINRKNEDLSVYPHGPMDRMIEYVLGNT